MKLFIIRHGDPDYTIDSLTERAERKRRCWRKDLKMLR